MENTTVKMTIRSHKESRESAEVDFVLDSGFAYAVAPEGLLRRLGVEATGEEVFFLGTGEKVVRRTGDAHFVMGERSGYAKVMFGEPGDVNLVGTRTLEALGLMLDPFTRELTPLPTVMLLM